MSESVADTLAELGGFVSDFDYEDLPGDGVRQVERCFVDTVGVTIAGAVEGAGELAADTIGGLGVADRGPATIVGHDWSGTVLEAAFVNGTAGHGLDFDDVADPTSNHPSVTMVAPLLAVGEARELRGRDVIAAFAVGYETQYRLAGPIMPAHYEAGWHSTATFGTFGAAAAVANAVGLSPGQARRALNIAASMPAGLWRNFGSDTKPMHAGQAARSGTLAALLAEQGFTAGDDAITGEGGFFDLYTPPEGYDGTDPGGSSDRLGIVEHGVHVKKYPCCYFTHASIEAAIALREEHDIDPSDVAAVEVTASEGAADALSYEDPRTGLEAKFSMHYCVASALARGGVDLGAFDEANLDDPSVQALGERISFEVDPSLPYPAHDGTVRVELRNGESHERSLASPPGTADDPLPAAALEEKFLMCATRRFDESRAAEAYRRCDGLREVSTVRDVTALL